MNLVHQPQQVRVGNPTNLDYTYDGGGDTYFKIIWRKCKIICRWWLLVVNTDGLRVLGDITSNFI